MNAILFHRRAARAASVAVAVPVCLALLLATAGTPACAARTTERSKQKVVVEAERAAVQQKLTALKRSIDRTETEKDSAVETLAASEQAISNANRSLRELADEQAKTEAKQRQLAGSYAQLSGTVAAQQKHLATLLREQYVAGNEDRVKLLLSGDNPNRINRDLQYLAYVSQAEAKLIAALRTNIAAVAANQLETQNASDELDEIEEEARDQKAVLEKEKARRAAVLAQVSNKLTKQRKEAGNLARDEQLLSSLVEKLAKMIEEQRKAEALAQQKRRQEQAERERLAALEKQRQLEAKAKSKGKTKIDDDKPAIAKVEPKPKSEPESARTAPAFTVADGAFSALRGQLKPPVRGTPAAKFGSKRGDGPSWKGWFIKAASGTDIKAVADGQVVFAEWMGRYGNLIMVDHGNNYLSIYGNNQTLFKRKDDIVKAGDTIAAAGNTGGNEESGLYFELRFKGAAIDPAAWIKF